MSEFAIVSKPQTVELFKGHEPLSVYKSIKIYEHPLKGDEGCTFILLGNSMLRCPYAIDVETTIEWIEKSTWFIDFTNEREQEFYIWMCKTNKISIKATGMGLLDFPDIAWHDLFDDDATPSEAVTEMIQNASGG